MVCWSDKRNMACVGGARGARGAWKRMRSEIQAEARSYRTSTARYDVYFNYF